MRRNTNTTLAIVLLFVWAGFANPAAAGINVSVDWDATLANGIQSSIVANPGDTVTATIVFAITDSSSLSTYEVSTRFSSSKLQFVSRTGTGPVDLPTTVPPGGVNSALYNNQNTGLLDPIVGFYGFNQFIAGTVPNFGDPGPTSTAAPFAVATITFTVLPGASGTVLIPGLFNEPGILDSFFDNSNTQIPENQLTFNGGSITAVPEPSTVAILSCTLAAVGARRFRKLFVQMA